MPFGKYKDMKHCISLNGNKKDPAAYCATIMRKMEGENVKLNYPTLIEKYEVEENIPRQGLKAIIVHGTAAKEVISRNGVKYLAKELEKATPSLKGKPILKDHKNDVDHIIGKVLDTKYDVQDKSIKFKGMITDEKIQQLVLNGLVNHVSIGASVKNLKQEESNGEKCMIAEGLEILELSVTPVPGIADASIMPGEQFAIALQEAYENDDSEEEDWDEVIARKIDAKLKDKLKTEEVQKMPEDQNIQQAKEAFAETISALDNSFTKEELMKCDFESLKILLNKAKNRKKEETTVEATQPKGVVSQPLVEEKKEDVLVIPAGADEALRKVKAGTFVVERNNGKMSFFKMPDYKKTRAY